MPIYSYSVKMHRYANSLVLYATVFALSLSLSLSLSLCGRSGESREGDTVRVGCFFSGWGALKFQSISGRLPDIGGKRRDMIYERKKVQTTPTHTYCKRSKSLP